MGRGWYKTLWKTTPSCICKHTAMCTRVLFFCHYYLATSIPDWAQILAGLLFYAYVEIQQVRRLVLDNYQQCPVSLSNYVWLSLCWPMSDTLASTMHIDSNCSPIPFCTPKWPLSAFQLWFFLLLNRFEKWFPKKEIRTILENHKVKSNKL